MSTLTPELIIPPLGELKDLQAAKPAILARMWAARLQGVPPIALALIAAEDTTRIQFGTKASQEPITLDQRVVLLGQILREYSVWEARKIANPSGVTLEEMVAPPDGTIVEDIMQSCRAFLKQVVDSDFRHILNQSTGELIQFYLAETTQVKLKPSE
jgi:hypothetical protein